MVLLPLLLSYHLFAHPQFIQIALYPLALTQDQYVIAKKTQRMTPQHCVHEVYVDSKVDLFFWLLREEMGGGAGVCLGQSLPAPSQ